MNQLRMFQQMRKTFVSVMSSLLMVSNYWKACERFYFAHFQADMLSVPPSRLGYAQECAPASITRHPQHLNSVKHAV